MLSSKIVLGTAQFGLKYGINNKKGKPSREQVFEILNFAASQGVKVLDTADAYGNAIELLGEFNIINPGLFEINTKFRLDKNSLEEKLSNTLDLLNLKTVNTYFYHSFKDFLEYPDLYRELESLKKKNMIIKTGVSVYDNYEFRKAIFAPQIDVIQFPFNLLDNYNLRGSEIKLAKANGKELQVRSIFLQGLFFMSFDKVPSKIKKLIPYLEKIQNLSITSHIPVEHLSILYALLQSDIDNIILGIESLEQLQNNLKCERQKLSTAVISNINRIRVQETELLNPQNWT
jgi:aryl-alcohol dehydrogenase-like predicted oxidoreductase